MIQAFPKVVSIIYHFVTAAMKTSDGGQEQNRAILLGVCYRTANPVHTAELSGGGGDKNV